MFSSILPHQFLPPNFPLEDELQQFSSWASDWQTLIAAGIAFFAARLAWKATNAQTKLQREQENARLSAYELSARATLPLALSGVSEFAELVAIQFGETYGQDIMQNVLGEVNRPEAPSVPQESIQAIENTIRATRNADVQHALADLVSEIQVLAVRSAELARREDRLSIYWATDNILSASRLYGIAASLFDYSRREKEEVTERDDFTLARQMQRRFPNLRARLDPPAEDE